MTKQSKSQDMKKKEPAHPAKKKKRPRREVQVVTCPFDFPTAPSNKRNAAASFQHDTTTKNVARHENHESPEQVLDWNDTSREIKQLASSAFSATTKRQYKQEEYQRLTGRNMKQQACSTTYCTRNSEKGQATFGNQSGGSKVKWDCTFE